MPNRTRYLWRILLGATALSIPHVASAETAREADLMARLERLESEMATLRADLAAARGQQAETAATAAAAATKSDEAAARVATLESKPQPPAEGWRDGNSVVRLGGYIKTTASISRYSDGALAANALGRDFYLPQQIPVGGTAGSTNHDFSAKQSRLWLNMQTDVAGHVLKGYLETDFQTTASAAPAIAGGGSQRTTNGYTLALRRAYVQIDRLTIGQDWSTFQNVSVLPESTDFVGVTEGTAFIRQALARYSAPLGKGTTLHLAIENAETASATASSPALVENDRDRLPDFAVRLNHAATFGEVSLAGVARELSVNGTSDRTLGWGASAAGKLWLNGDKTADLRVMASYGEGIGRYLGVNFGPDAIHDAVGDRLRRTRTAAAFAALRLPLATDLRVNLMGSWQHVSYPDGFAPGTFNGFNRSAWSGAANLFYSPVRNVDLGIEYRHGERTLVSGASGQLDRVEMAAKYNF